MGTLFVHEAVAEDEDRLAERVHAFPVDAALVDEVGDSLVRGVVKHARFVPDFPDRRYEIGHDEFPRIFLDPFERFFEATLVEKHLGLVDDEQLPIRIGLDAFVQGEEGDFGRRREEHGEGTAVESVQQKEQNPTGEDDHRVKVRMFAFEEEQCQERDGQREVDDDRPRLSVEWPHEQRVIDGGVSQISRHLIGIDDAHLGEVHQIAPVRGVLPRPQRNVAPFVG